MSCSLASSRFVPLPALPGSWQGRTACTCCLAADCPCCLPADCACSLPAAVPAAAVAGPAAAALPCLLFAAVAPAAAGLASCCLLALASLLPLAPLSFSLSFRAGGCLDAELPAVGPGFPFAAGAAAAVSVGVGVTVKTNARWSLAAPGSAAGAAAAAASLPPPDADLQRFSGAPDTDMLRWRLPAGFTSAAAACCLPLPDGAAALLPAGCRCSLGAVPAVPGAE